MVIHPGYVTERVIVCASSIVFCFISAIQARCSFRGQKAKFGVHVFCFLGALLTFVSELDPDGVFEFLPKLLSELAFAFSICCLLSAFCFFVLSHFQPLYHQMKTQVPRLTILALVAAGVSLWILLQVGTIFKHRFRQTFYDFVGEAGAVSYILLVVLADYHAYVSLKKVVEDASAQQTESSSDEQRNRLPDYTMLSLQMSRFQFFFMVLTGIATLSTLATLSNSISDFNEPPATRSPETYDFQWLLLANLGCWIGLSLASWTSLFQCNEQILEENGVSIQLVDRKGEQPSDLSDSQYPTPVLQTKLISSTTRTLSHISQTESPTDRLRTCSLWIDTADRRVHAPIMVYDADPEKGDIEMNEIGRETP